MVVAGNAGSATYSWLMQVVKESLSECLYRYRCCHRADARYLASLSGQSNFGSGRHLICHLSIVTRFMYLEMISAVC